MNQATAQEMFLGIISSVEAGVMTPEEALEEQTRLNRDARGAVKFDYQLHNFQSIRELAISTPIPNEDDLTLNGDDYDDYFGDFPIERGLDLSEEGDFEG